MAQQDESKAASAAQVQDHIEALGLETVDEYRVWCRTRGLSPSLHKGRNQRRKEIEFDQTAQAAKALTALRRQTRRPGRTIERIFSGSEGDGLKADYLARIRVLADELEPLPAVKDRFRVLVECVEKQSDLLRQGSGASTFGSG